MFDEAIDAADQGQTTREGRPDYMTIADLALEILAARGVEITRETIREILGRLVSRGLFYLSSEEEFVRRAERARAGRIDGPLTTTDRRVLFRTMQLWLRFQDTDGE